MQFNVERALQRSFHIRKPPSLGDCVLKTGLEITGLAVASQDALELQELAHSKGFKDIKYDFVPNCKWSCINFNKLKVQWAMKCQQTTIDGKQYNILPGAWSEDGKIFNVDALSTNIDIVIQPILASASDSDSDSDSSSYILLPFHTYQVTKDISTLMPALKFGKKQLECINPKDLQSISINRQGIYVNRRHRDKIDEVTLDSKSVYSVINAYNLCVYHNKSIIFHEDLNA
jgi:hypothetical protein